MSNRFFIVFACIFTACSLNNNEQAVTIDSASGDDLLVFHIDGTVKSSLSGNVPVWSEGDAISVIAENGVNRQFTLIDGAGTAMGTFRGNLPVSDRYVAVYPYDANTSLNSGVLHFRKRAEQVCTESDFALGGNVMVATFTRTSQAPVFKNVFGLVELSLAGTASVGRIELKSGNDGEMLWGDCSLLIDGYQGTDAQTLSASSGSATTSIAFPSAVKLTSSSPKPFYFILPGGTLGAGFTMDIYDDADNLIYTKTTTKPQTVIRSDVRQMPALNDVYRIPSLNVKPEPYSWAAYSNLARTGTADETVIDPQTSGYPSRASRGNRYAGIFYCVWHGYDHSFGQLYGPYNIQSFLGAGNYNFQPADTRYGGEGMAHHWGEPYFGYYIAGDTWVTRRHAQLLVDAGIDFIAIDLTNNVFYLDAIRSICDTYADMREHGTATPQITFIFAHGGDGDGVAACYNAFYSNPKYADLWFKWEGKPLILGDKTKVDPSLAGLFTFRLCWFLWNSQWQTPADAGDPWWGNGEDRWPWGCCYTADTPADGQKAGVHNGVEECVSVMPATHPVSNVGRSYPVGQGITYSSGTDSYEKQPAKGLYFKSQFEAANALDPKVLFFTGWNEWVAQRASDGAGNLAFYYMGGTRSSNNSVFVDQYNHEFSRDIEPLNGDFGDNYYYYMADFIRQFKGADPTPVFTMRKTITIDGNFTDWWTVESCYADEKDDIHGRSWAGWGGISSYAYPAGRNDLYKSQTVTDGTNLYFYMEAASELTGYADATKGLNLLISTGGRSNWEGFDYILTPTSATQAVLKHSNGGWSWAQVSDQIRIAVSGNAMEIAIPLSNLGITSTGNFKVDFKWVDDVDLSQPDGIQQCMKYGDSAPNGRFRYRYVFKK